jgi:hypothetical protein
MTITLTSSLVSSTPLEAIDRLLLSALGLLLLTHNSSKADRLVAKPGTRFFRLSLDISSGRSVTSVLTDCRTRGCSLIASSK